MGQVFHPTFVDKNTNSIQVMRTPIGEWKLMEQCWCGGGTVICRGLRTKLDF
jgi:hypothetical protein